MHRGAQGHARDGRFGDRGVDHALLAELVNEAVSREEYAASNANILAKHEDTLVAHHLFAHRLAHRFEYVHHCHRG